MRRDRRWRDNQLKGAEGLQTRVRGDRYLTSHRIDDLETIAQNAPPAAYAGQRVVTLIHDVVCSIIIHGRKIERRECTGVDLRYDHSMDALYRIIDANSNRAREAMRVLEDIARFALNDAALSSAYKSLRHDFQAAIDRIAPDRSALIASRDTPGDIGTAITTTSEHVRSDLHALAGANASRLTEALRSIEEAVKLLPGATSTAFESLRYRAYEADRCLTARLRAHSRKAPKLCVLITETLCRLPWIQVVERAIDGGADAIQLREKNLESDELLRRARSLARLCDGRGVTCFVNDRPDIALLSGAHGVHVGQTDLPVSAVRELAGSRLIVGVSTGNLIHAERAIADGADLCGVGPMFHTSTKHKPVIAGPEYLREYIERCPLPHLAIGGVTPENVLQLKAVGCRGIAVSSCVCDSREPEAVCADLLAKLTS